MVNAQVVHDFDSSGSNAHLASSTLTTASAATATPPCHAKLNFFDTVSVETLYSVLQETQHHKKQRAAPRPLPSLRPHATITTQATTNADECTQLASCVTCTHDANCQIMTQTIADDSHSQTSLTPTEELITTTGLTSSKLPTTSSRIRQDREIKELNASEKGKYYRAKQREHFEALTQSVGKLRQEVLTLIILRRRLSRIRYQTTTKTIHNAIRRAITKYCRLFQTGVHLPVATESRHLQSFCVQELFGNHNVHCVDPLLVDQKQFLEDHMARNVRVNGAVLGGVNRILEIWSSFKKWHAWFQMDTDLSAMQLFNIPNAPVGVVAGTISVSMTRYTLARMFPHIQLDELDATIALEIRYPVVHRFYFESGWDDQRCRFHRGTLKIEHYDVEVDFLGGLFQAFDGNLQLVNLLMEGMVELFQFRNEVIV